MDAIREIGIFIVIAQAILYFVPGEAYVKYVKVIIGIIMIAKMAQPVLAFADGGEWEQLLEQTAEFSSAADWNQEEMETVDNSGEIKEKIEEELAARLNQRPLEGYIVSGVFISEEEGEEDRKITVTVSKGKKDTVKEIKVEKISLGEADGGEKEESGFTKGETEQLKAYYGEILGVDPDNLWVTSD